MKLDPNIEKELKELWPDRWEGVLAFYEKSEIAFNTAPENVREKMGEDYIDNLIKQRIKGRKETLKFEKEVLEKIIPKNKLENSATYLAMEGTERLCRHIEEAKWDKKEQKFWYTRNKFGHEFEDLIDHFEDVINDGYAGFTPIKKL